MKFKKVLSVVMAAAAVFSFAACGASGNGGSGSGNGSGSGGNGGNGSGGNGGGNNGSGGSVNDITVTFDAGEGEFKSGDDTVKIAVDGNGKVSAPSVAPVRDGYAFKGWVKGGSAFDPSTVHTAAATYTATYVSGSVADGYDSLFDEDSVVSVDIDMSDAEWKKLSDDYDRFDHHKSPIYRMADSVTVTVKDENGEYAYYYEEVGVRMKGNTSRRTFYGDDGFYASVHYKLSFTQTFDDEDEYEESERKTWSDSALRSARKKRTLFGLEKLDLKYNRNQDETYTKDIFAMRLFRENGIAAPHATLCGVSAIEKDTKKRNLGVYMLYEAVDEAFLTRNFKGDDGGDLYKCSWGNSYDGASLTRVDNLIGVENELKGKFYAYDKKTNKKKDAQGNRDFSSMTEFITEINKSGADYSELIDTDYFARFEAVNYLLGNPDCIRNHYNNYYIYFRPSDGRAVIIPYDYDRCLGISKDWAPYNACLELYPYDTRTTAGEVNGGEQINPLYKNLITDQAPGGAGSVKAKYTEYLIALASSESIKAIAFDALKNKYKAHYDTVTKTAINSNNTRFDANDTGNMTYSYYIEHKLDKISTLMS